MHALAQEPAKPLQTLLEAKHALIEELQADRDHWRDLAMRLEQRQAELQQAALPPLRRQRWWSWFVRRRTSTLQ